MIAWTFKNKIRSADDNEFLNYWRNKDKYPQKLIYYIEQEARNRFFSNKDFNGDDDIYVHPVILSQLKNNRRKRLLKISLTLSVLLLISGLFYFLPSSFYSNFTYPVIPVQIAQWFDGMQLKPDPATNNAVAMVEKEKDENTKTPLATESKTPVTDEAAVTDAIEDIVEKPKQADLQPVGQPGKNTDSKVAGDKPEALANASTVKKKDTKNSVANRGTISAAPKKVTEPTTTPESETGIIANPDISTETPEVNPPTPVTDQPKVADDAGTTTKPEPKVEPVALKTDLPQDSEDITNAQMLSNTLLREYIPFLNDWAFKQTQQQEISDYYVENNSLVNFKITKMYSDSIPVFKDEKLQMLMNNYWESLDVVLGSDFPRIAIAIKFIRFDDDL
jgi:hypothetical protein